MTIRTNIATKSTRNAWRAGVRAVSGFRSFDSNQQISNEMLCRDMACERTESYLPMHNMAARPGGAV